MLIIVYDYSTKRMFIGFCCCVVVAEMTRKTKQKMFGCKNLMYSKFKGILKGAMDEENSIHCSLGVYINLAFPFISTSP